MCTKKQERKKGGGGKETRKGEKEDNCNAIVIEM